MRPFSDTCHKALLSIGGTTILARIVDALQGIGVRRVTVVTGYRADEVREYLIGLYPDVAWHFVNNERFAETNNIVSLSMALDCLEFDEDVVLFECDLLFDQSVIERLANAPSGNVALVDHYRTGMDGTVVSVAAGIVSQVFPPHLQGPGFHYDDKFKTLNIYRFDTTFCRRTLQPLLSWYANEINANHYYELILGMLVSLPDHNIAAEVVRGDLWAEVDDPNDLAAARFQFEPHRRAEIVDRAFGGYWNFDIVDFAFIRNMYFPTDAMLAAMRHSLAAVITSYGSKQEVLNEKLGWFLGCDAGRLQVLHGAAQAFPILRGMLVGKTVAVPAPTFGEYARMFPNAVTYLDRPGVDAGELARLAAQVDVIVVVNPNNPTGTTLATRDIHELARDHPRTTFLVDESFLDFSAEPSLVAELERHPLHNVIVLVSLSKSLGVPGLRLGYLYSTDDAVTAAVVEQLPIWNLGALAEFFLEILLKSRTELAGSVVQTVEDREIFRRQLAAVAGVAHVNTSGANFILVRLGGAHELADHVRRTMLSGSAMDVKDVSLRFADRRARLRVAVRKPLENQRFADELEKILGSFRPKGDAEAAI